MQVIKTGIKGYDKLFEQGIPLGSNILVMGKPGTGKTIFSLEFAYKGLQMKEPAVYISFEQSRQDIIEQCSLFGWDIKKYINNGKLILMTPTIDEVDRDILNKITDAVRKIKAKRLIIDTLSFLSVSPIFSKEEKFTLLDGDKVLVAYELKQFIYNLVTALNKTNTTTMYLTSHNDTNMTSLDEISEYVCDGITVLRTRVLGKSYMRTIQVMKMRKTQIDCGIHRMEISKEGIVVGE